MDIHAVHALWTEPKNFVLERDKIEDFYVFVHFHTRAKTYQGDTIYEGACILYKPYSYRYFKAEDCELCHDWIHIDGDVASLAKKYNIEFNRFYYPEDSYSITDIVSGIEIENQTNNKHGKKMCKLKFEEILIKMSRESDESKTFKIDADTYNRLMQAHNILRTHYNEAQSIDNIAFMIGLSISRFYVLYRQIFGISPKQDLLNIRIAHAKELLSHKKYTVYEVAELTGYTNPYHFTRQFKSHTGLTPSQYLKSNN